MRSLWRKFQSAGARSLFLVTGAAALVWFLVRVIPKPSRATYPCQRVAFPLASSFVAYIVGLGTTALAIRKARQRLQQSRYLLAVICIVIGVTAAWVTISVGGEEVKGEFIPSDPVNTPVGEGKGIYPGRVVWVHDPNSTSWDGVSAYWWSPENTNQAVVEQMLSKTVCWLTNESTDEDAWDSLFRHFNNSRGKGNIGYTYGEKIVIKINMNNSGRGNKIDASPHMVLGMLRQLVYQAGIGQSAINIYDAVRTIEAGVGLYDYCYVEFPDVRYNDNLSWVADAITYSAEVTHADSRKLPQCVLDADYMINMAILKRHDFRTAVTLCGKNHFGTIAYPPGLHLLVQCWVRGIGTYDPQVDLMGHKNLGGKTVLYLLDALYGSDRWNGVPVRWTLPPFNNHWPSSIFASQDPVAIDSVGLDFLNAEWILRDHADNYLHEAALANDPLSGVFYDPEGDANSLPSLGVHEHWNNPIDKQYSRNLGIGDGIELISSEPQMCADWFKADVTADCMVDFTDLAALTDAWLAEPGSSDWNVACDIAPDGGDDVIDSQDFAVLAEQWQEGVQTIRAAVSLNNQWMYQNLPGETDSTLTASEVIFYDPLDNSEYTHSWEYVLAADADVLPTTVAGGGSGDMFWTFAAPDCDEVGGLSDSGLTFKVKVTITGLDHGNTGTAEADFGIALLGDVNNDTVVNIADRAIINAFWITGAAGSFTLKDCDLNCDGTVNVADRSIANAIWRGVLGQNSVSSPCLFR